MLENYCIVIKLKYFFFFDYAIHIKKNNKQLFIYNYIYISIFFFFFIDKNNKIPKKVFYKINNFIVEQMITFCQVKQFTVNYDYQ